MRIIAGRLKGRRLAAPEAGDQRVRPTSDRAREALFSILQRWPQGAFLDLFAGTGAVGIEAWSRGYGPVTCVETGEPGWSCLRENARGSDVALLRKDARKLGAEAFRDQAVVFADPPYGQSAALWASLAPALRAWIAPDGVLVWEGASGEDLELQPGWAVAETREYGAARFTFWQPA
jgi:16S rRNA (guanine966-N2)-methyltransferase